MVRVKKIARGSTGGKAVKKTPVKKSALPKKASKLTTNNEGIVVPGKGDDYYMLFNANELKNSDDPAYELEYAFKGVYFSEEEAVEEWAIETVERENDLEREFFKDGKVTKTVEDLEKAGWKILEVAIPRPPKKFRAPKNIEDLEELTIPKSPKKVKVPKKAAKTAKKKAVPKSPEKDEEDVLRMVISRMKEILRGHFVGGETGYTKKQVESFILKNSKNIREAAIDLMDTETDGFDDWSDSDYADVMFPRIKLPDQPSHVARMAAKADPAEEEQLEMVKQNGNDIRFIKKPSEKVQLAAVKQDKESIVFITNPSAKVKKAAGVKTSAKAKVAKKKSKKI